MSWPELYDIIKIQAEFAVMRYEEPERRKDKIQELICQAYELYLNYLAKGKPIDKNQFKQFITKRSREVDKRSICKAKYGGTSTLDVLCYMRRRNDSPTPIIAYDDWMTASTRSKQIVDDTLAFHVDYHDWIAKLTALQKRIFQCLVDGYKCSKIAEMLKTSATRVKETINELRRSFIRFFNIQYKSLSYTT